MPLAEHAPEEQQVVIEVLGDRSPGDLSRQVPAQQPRHVRRRPGDARGMGPGNFPKPLADLMRADM